MVEEVVQLLRRGRGHNLGSAPAGGMRRRSSTRGVAEIHQHAITIRRRSAIATERLRRFGDRASCGPLPRWMRTTSAAPPKRPCSCRPRGLLRSCNSMTRRAGFSFREETRLDMRMAGRAPADLRQHGSAAAISAQTTSSWPTIQLAGVVVGAVGRRQRLPTAPPRSRHSRIAGTRGARRRRFLAPRGPRGGDLLSLAGRRDRRARSATSPVSAH